MIGLINVFGELVSAAWKGLSQDEKAVSELIKGLSAPVSPNQTRINAYINQYTNGTLASSNQTLSSDVDKKVYEVVVFPSSIKDNNSLAIGVCPDELNNHTLVTESSKRVQLTDLVGAAYKLGILFYKFVTLDSSLFKKTRILQIESVKNNISSSSLDQNQLANLVKDSSNKNIGELATASSDQSFISVLSNLIVVKVNQLYLSLGKNPFALSNYPSKEELKKSLEAPVSPNQTRIEDYKRQFENITGSNWATNSSESVDKNFNKTDDINVL